MNPKEKFYSQVIEIQKKTGQGLSGIVKVKSSEYAQYLDEFIEEGLIEACGSGTTIGHPESNIFYMPTKGYNVWKDDNKSAIHFVRLYLGIVKEERETKITPCLSDFLQDPEIIGNYAEWLKKNKDALEIMLNLDDTYLSTEPNFSTKDLEIIKATKWYKDSLSVSEFLKGIKLEFDYIDEKIDISKKLIKLYQYDLKKYESDLENSKKEIEKLKQEKKLWVKIERLLNSEDSMELLLLLNSEI